MSEFLAEARILVRPDTSRFRTDLEAQLKSVLARPVQIPVVPVVTGNAFAATIAGTSALTAAQQEASAATVITADALASATTISRQYAGAVDLAAVSTKALAAAQETEAAAATTAAAAQARSTAQLGRGAAASGLSLLGLRGATLAASGAFLAGTAAVVGFTKAVQSAAQLETELNVFKVTASATADEMDRVSAASQQLGRDLTLPGVTASDAATAMTELAKSGLSVRDSLAAARGTLQLATAAQISNAEAAKLVSSALNSFQLSGEEAVKVADLFAGAAASAQGSIQDFGPALGQASAVAHAFGLSIGDTVTLLTELAKAGLQGGRAGTSLRVALLRLVNPPAEAAKALKDLNIQVRDINGNLRPQVFTDIETALQGVSKAQRQATEAIIFGSDAVRTQVILGQAGANAFDEISAAVNRSGLAQEQAAARTQGLQGDFENLSNQASALGLVIGQIASGPTSALVQSLASMVSQMTLAAEGAAALGAKIGDIGSAVAGAIPFVDKIGLSFGDIAKATTFLNPLTGQLALAAKAAQVFGVNSDEAAKKTSVFGSIADSTTASVNDLVKALSGAAAALKTQLPQADTGLGVKQIQNVIGGFDAQQVRAQIQKDNGELLDVLQTEQSFLEAQLQRQFVKNRPALKRLIEQNLLGVVNDISAAQASATSKAAKLKSDAEKAARDAAAAASAREQALLAQFGVARDQRQNQIASAAQTKGLQDDINQEKKLKALVLAQIAQVKERISLEGGRKAAIVALQGVLTQVNGALQQLAQQQAAARAEQRARLVQSASLDVDLAQTTGNQAAEVAARKRLITQLKAQQALTKRGTLEWKQLRNDIATQNAAIAGVTAEKKKQGQSFAQASFEFLQTQQGFASNLLGNLIPGGQTAGLVGGGRSPVDAALTPIADTSTKSGPTSGQANATNHILNLILGQLKQINGTAAAPESHAWRAWQNGVMDGVGGG